MESNHPGSSGAESSYDSSRERRTGARHPACVPAYLETLEGTKRTAVTWDLSVSGALMLTRNAPRAGETVRVELYFDELENKRRIADGFVIRSEPLDASHSGTWSHTVAVRFDELLTELEPMMKGVAEHQAKIGLPR